MRRLVAGTVSLATVALAAFLAAGPCRSEVAPLALAGACVYTYVTPSVTIAANTASVNAGSVHSGDFAATASFRIEANQSQVDLYVEATDLFKGGDPIDLDIPPIPLNRDKGVVIDPSRARPLDGGGEVARFIGQGTSIGAFPTQRTATVTYESSQANGFDQDVFVTVTWTQDLPSRSRGRYSGRIRLCVLLLPERRPAAP